MTKQEAIDYFKRSVAEGNTDDERQHNEALDMAIKALEQEPCDDAISRQSLLNNLEKPMNWTDSEAEVQEQRDYESFVSLIESMPPVTPQQKIGHWIEVDIRNCHATLKCSVCDRIIEPTFTFGEYSYEDINRYYPYCHCGAKMEVGE